MKKTIVLLVMGVMLISFCQMNAVTNAAMAPITNYASSDKLSAQSSTSSDLPHSISFKNVNVRISGFCRTLIYSNGYLGGYRSGYLPYVGASVSSGDERINVVIKDSSGKTLFSKTGITNGIVFIANANGNFYWSAYGNGHSIVPPSIYMNCHAEEIYVTIGSYGNNAASHQQVLQNIQ